MIYIKGLYKCNRCGGVFYGPTIDSVASSNEPTVVTTLNNIPEETSHWWLPNRIFHDCETKDFVTAFAIVRDRQTAGIGSLIGITVD